MAGDLSRETDRALEEGRSLVRDNRDGGRHRRAVSIGKGSAELRTRHIVTKLKRIGVTVGAIVAGAIVTGMIVNGIGFIGVMVSAMLIMCAIAVFSGQKLRPPKRADLAKIADARPLVARTELWLEHQRAGLPPPAVRLVEQIGLQLDALGLQLEHVEPLHPAAVETRKLVGETLPGMIEAYRKIPAHLRGEERAGGTPDQQLVESLGKISNEIDHVTRQLADGALDDLAIRTRYLDYRYGAAGEPEALDQTATQALPAPDPLEQLNRLPERDKQEF
ncbi:MAG TPA: hypothetical protein VI168_08850 [Croceibacterium sp.]